jgi:hypothetical protein
MQEKVGRRFGMQSCGRYLHRKSPLGNARPWNLPLKVAPGPAGRYNGERLFIPLILQSERPVL